MSAETLTTLSLGARVYRVTGGKSPHRVTLEPVTCDCADFIYKGEQRTPPMCKHVAAVLSFRATEPQADLVDSLTESETLDLIDPSHGNRKIQLPESPAIDEEDRAIALIARARWQEYHNAKRRPPYLLWRAAVCTAEAMECEQSAPGNAAQLYAAARGMVEAMREGAVA